MIRTSRYIESSAPEQSGGDIPESPAYLLARQFDWSVEVYLGLPIFSEYFFNRDFSSSKSGDASQHAYILF